MSQAVIVGVLVVLACGVGALALWLYLSYYDSEDGERYRRIRMQGPFAPLSAEELEDDARRIKERKAEG